MACLWLVKLLVQVDCQGQMLDGVGSACCQDVDLHPAVLQDAEGIDLPLSRGDPGEGVGGVQCLGDELLVQVVEAVCERDNPLRQGIMGAP
ncbi:hypothetical protein ACFQ8O_02440 [Streptomyces coelicoflavus]|uniref:hypothetical protein n=1 Tax=Streptomyces coelicoflavus TaxID=285562 RepID=UPI00368AF527